MKTVKVSNRKGESRRVELFDHTPDGIPHYSVLCRAGSWSTEEFPHSRTGLVGVWEKDGEICGTSDNPMQWWVAI